jgi:pyrroline-5-carboxylate reductase
MSDPLPQSLTLVGAGKMGGAMLDGWLSIGVNGAGITLLDPHVSDEMQALAAAEGHERQSGCSEAQAEVVVLATKPQMLDTAAPSVQALIGPKTLLISVLAGKTLGDLSARLPNANAIVRAMPNLPASVETRRHGRCCRPARASATRSGNWPTRCSPASARSNGSATRG